MSFPCQIPLKFPIILKIRSALYCGSCDWMWFEFSHLWPYFITGPWANCVLQPPWPLNMPNLFSSQNLYTCFPSAWNALSPDFAWLISFRLFCLCLSQTASWPLCNPTFCPNLSLFLTLFQYFYSSFNLFSVPDFSVNVNSKSPKCLRECLA